jgi:peroxiredoxin (alkyl hydroperoxide reductase subunit C)
MKSHQTTPCILENVPCFPRIGEQAPDFKADSTFGTISLSDFAGRWVVLFSHPEDFTPICTSEILAFAAIQPKLQENNCILMGLSTDTNRSHITWIQTIEEFTGEKIGFPIIADEDKKIASRYGMIMQGEHGEETSRGVFIIDPQQRIRAFSCYPVPTGRNTEEILRLVQALQISDLRSIATPANWQPGGLVVNYASTYSK